MTRQNYSTLQAKINKEIEKLQKSIVEKHGFEMVDHNLVLYVRKKK